MASALAALSLAPQSIMPPTKRKRARSSVEIFTLPPAATIASTKRARTGIQGLITDSPESGPRYPSLLPLVAILPHPTPSLNKKSEDQDLVDEDSENYSTSSSESSEESDYDNDEEMAGLEGGYASDYESGSTTTTSSSSSSSSSDDKDYGEDDDDDDGVDNGDSLPRLKAIAIPTRIHTSKISPSRSALAARIKSFLPRLAASNRELDEEGEMGRLGDRNIEDISDEAGKGERYIEMNLGLGVLEERTEGVGDCSAEDGDGESDAGAVVEDKIRIKRKTMKGDVMATLMGIKEAKRPDIRILG